MSEQPTPTIEPTSTPEATRPAALRWFGHFWPHALTALIAIAASLGLQLLFQPAATTTRTSATSIPAIATVTPQPVVLPTPIPVPTALPPASDITRQELLDLRAEDDRIWAAIYLSRAISQIADAETALRQNDLERADLMIVATDDTLALAYERTATALRDPIAQLRRDTSLIREDLYIRPEGMDTRLSRLRQTLLALIAERN
jgi:hypothetical protein